MSQRKINSIAKNCFDELKTIGEFKELNAYEETSIKATINALYQIGKESKTCFIDTTEIVCYLEFCEWNMGTVDKVRGWLSEKNSRGILSGYNLDEATKNHRAYLVEKLKNKEIEYKMIEY